MSERRVKVGVLSIQGAFAEHVSMLEREGERRKKDVGITVVEVRNPSDLDELDGLIIPGGESTTLSVFLRQNDFEEKLKSFVSNEKKFVWGTCAGLILLSDELDSQKKGGQITVCIDYTIYNISQYFSPFQLGGINILTTRNAYGSQINSFEGTLKLKDPALINSGQDESGLVAHNDFPGIFIRAPKIEKLNSPLVQPLATLADGSQEIVVAVRQGRLLGTSFHPELTSDLRWHSYFLDMIIASKFP